MNDFGFKLTPAYCLYNGVAVLQQEGTYIKFLIENEADELLKARLKRSFENHIEMINTSIHKGQHKKIIPLKRANLNYLSGTEVCFLHREFAKYSTEF